jgi:hypothetical protein
MSWLQDKRQDGQDPQRTAVVGNAGEKLVRGAGDWLRIGSVHDTQR